MTELEILNHALTTRYGVRVSTSNPTTLYFRFHGLKQKHDHLKSLLIQKSRDNPDSELWIINAQAIKPTAGAEEAGPAV